MAKQNIKIQIKGGKMVETTNQKGYILDWDGLYYNFYGRNRHIVHNGKSYNCFPIVVISEDLSSVVDITMFGCQDNSFCEDGYLDIPVDYTKWTNLKGFKELMDNNASNYNQYHLIGMMLHPEGNCNDAQFLADYKVVSDMDYDAICLLKDKYYVDSDDFENFPSDKPYYLDQDSSGIYLYQKVTA